MNILLTLVSATVLAAVTEYVASQRNLPNLARWTILGFIFGPIALVCAFAADPTAPQSQRAPISRHTRADREKGIV